MRGGRGPRPGALGSRESPCSLAWAYFFLKRSQPLLKREITGVVHQISVRLTRWGVVDELTTISCDN